MGAAGTEAADEGGRDDDCEAEREETPPWLSATPFCFWPPWSLKRMSDSSSVLLSTPAPAGPAAVELVPEVPLRFGVRPGDADNNRCLSGDVWPGLLADGRMARLRRRDRRMVAGEGTGGGTVKTANAAVETVDGDDGPRMLFF